MTDQDTLEEAMKSLGSVLSEVLEGARFVMGIIPPCEVGEVQAVDIVANVSSATEAVQMLALMIAQILTEDPDFKREDQL